MKGEQQTGMEAKVLEGKRRAQLLSGASSNKT